MVHVNPHDLIYGLLKRFGKRSSLQMTTQNALHPKPVGAAAALRVLHALENGAKTTGPHGHRPEQHSCPRCRSASQHLVWIPVTERFRHSEAVPLQDLLLYQSPQRQKQERNTTAGHGRSTIRSTALSEHGAS